MGTSLRFLLLSLAVAGCAAPGSGDQVEVIQLVKSTESWNGRPLPAYARGTPEVTILRIIVPPGATLPVHEHPVINAGVLLRGRLTVETDSGDVLHLKSGDSIVEVVDTWHYGKNEGDEPAEIIVFYAGAVGQPLSVTRPGTLP